MPAESSRLRRPIASRDRRLIAAAACLAVAAAPAALVVGGRSHADASVRCVSTIRAGFMGGATYTYCGGHAAAACRAAARGDASLAAACRKQGFPAALAAP